MQIADRRRRADNTIILAQMKYTHIRDPMDLIEFICLRMRLAMEALTTVNLLIIDGNLACIITAQANCDEDDPAASSVTLEMFPVHIQKSS